MAITTTTAPCSAFWPSPRPPRLAQHSGHHHDHRALLSILATGCARLLLSLTIAANP